MKTGKSLVELATEIQNQREAKVDYTAPARALVLEPDGRTFALGDKARFEANGIFHQQIGTHLKIPKVYYDRMAGEAPALLANNVNRWLSTDPTKRLIRTLQNGDNIGRAFLSDRYRPLDNAELAEAVLPTFSEFGLNVVSCELTERKLYLKAVNEKVQGEVKRGDVVQAGVIISNSEVGMGSLSVSPLLYRLVCLNGLIINDRSVRKHHLGRAAGDDAVREYLTDEAREADDKATWLKLRDLTRAAVSDALFSDQLEKMREAAGMVIESNKLDKVIDVTAKRIDLGEAEKDSVLRHLIEGGDLSKWGLANAVTRMAQDVESYDRSTELEAIGSKIIELPKADWHAISTAGAA